MRFQQHIQEKRQRGFFETPENLAERMVRLAEIKEGQTVLEPSAGWGAIASYIPGCLLNEADPDNCKVLEERGYKSTCQDFLKMSGSGTGGYDRIVMNPPFSR